MSNLSNQTPQKSSYPICPLQSTEVICVCLKVQDKGETEENSCLFPPWQLPLPLYPHPFSLPLFHFRDLCTSPFLSKKEKQSSQDAVIYKGIQRTKLNQSTQN